MSSIHNRSNLSLNHQNTFGSGQREALQEYCEAELSPPGFEAGKLDTITKINSGKQETPKLHTDLYLWGKNHFGQLGIPKS